MAQIGVQQPTNLMEMFSSPSLMMGDIASQQVNDQTLGNLLNRQQAQQSMDFAAQEQPFKLDQLGLANDTTRAQLPGVKATSGLTENKLKQDNLTFDAQTKTALSKMAKEMSDNDLSTAENGVSQMMLHSDPTIRAQGKAMFPMIRAIAAERDKLNIQGGNQIANTRASVQGQKELEQMRIDAGKYKRADKYGLSLSQKLDAETDPRKKLGLLKEAATMANIEADKSTDSAAASDLKQVANEYMTRAKAYEPIVQQWLASQKPGGVDLETLSKGQVPTVKPTSLVDSPTGTATKTKPKFTPEQYSQWHIRAKQLNPGLSDADIEREAVSKGYK